MHPYSDTWLHGLSIQVDPHYLQGFHSWNPCRNMKSNHLDFRVHWDSREVAFWSFWGLKRAQLQSLPEDSGWAKSSSSEVWRIHTGPKLQMQNPHISWLNLYMLNTDSQFSAESAFQITRRKSALLFAKKALMVQIGHGKWVFEGVVSGAIHHKFCEHEDDFHWTLLNILSSWSFTFYVSTETIIEVHIKCHNLLGTFFFNFYRYSVNEHVSFINFIH